MYLICNWPQNHVYHIFLKKRKEEKKAISQNFYHCPAMGLSGKVFVLVLIVSVFFSFLCLTFLGKPAVLISDMHVGRAPWSPLGHRELRRISKFCSDLHRNSTEKIFLCCSNTQSKHLHSLHWRRPAAAGPEWPLGVPPLCCKTLTNAEKWCEGINTIGIAHQRVEKQTVI